MTYIFDLLDGKVGVRWYTGLLWLYVNDDEKRIRCVPFEELVDLQI